MKRSLALFLFVALFISSSVHAAGSWLGGGIVKAVYIYKTGYPAVVITKNSVDTVYSVDSSLTSDHIKMILTVALTAKSLDQIVTVYVENGLVSGILAQ